MIKSKKLADLPSMNDEELSDFWEKHEPEVFGDWEEGSLDFKRPPKKLIPTRKEMK